MFHVVDFKGGRKRTVVPDTWLSINDTLCLLPPNVTDSDLEVLVRNRVEPGDGWQMFGVKSLETFESYADAVKQSGKPKEAAQSQADPQRKRKKPSYLADYDAGGGDEASYAAFSTVDNEEDASENEWETPSAPQVLPRVVQVSSCNKRRIVQFNRSRPPEQQQKRIVEVKCACQSSCHSTILKALQTMQKQLDTTNQMVEQLLTGRPKTMNQKLNHRWTPNYKPRPQKVPWNPTNLTNGRDEMEDFSQDDTNFVQCVYQAQDTPVAQKSTETPKSTEAPTTSSAAAEDAFLTTSSIPYQPPTAQGSVLENIDVRKWLMLYPKGRELMHKLDSEIFFPRDRQLLVRILCKKLVEYCGNAYPTAIMKEKLAKDIVKAFPFLKSTRGEGHEAFYDIKTGQGFIGFRLKTYRKSFPEGERRHHLTNRKKQTEGLEVAVAVKEELLSPSDLEENDNNTDYNSDPINDINEDIVSTPSTSLDCSNISGPLIAEKSSKRIKRRTSTLVYPTPLPNFSPALKRYIENGTVLQHYRRFVRESAEFLLTLVEEPTRTDYNVYCCTLSQEYKFINDRNIRGTNPYAFFKKSLSNSIRNARYYAKKKEKKTSVPSVQVKTEENNTDYNTDPINDINGDIFSTPLTSLDCTGPYTAEKSSKKIKRRSSTLVYPSPLPDFSPSLKLCIENGTVIENYQQFVRESATFLLTLVDEPTKSDYNVYCYTLSEKYKFINDRNIPGTSAYASFKKSLSQSIRNARHYCKKKKETSASSVQEKPETDKVTD